MKAPGRLAYAAILSLYGLMIFFSLSIAAYGFAFELRILPEDEFTARLDLQPFAGTLHIVAASVALLLGGFQFSKKLRIRLPKSHQWTGRLYLLAVLAASLSGIALATNAGGGLVGNAGFALLGIAWFYTALQAYVSIRSGDINRHRRWVVRNFALTFAAVTLRLQLGVLQGFDVTFAEAYPLTAWLSWIPNLLIAEWLILEAADRKHIV